MHVCMYVCATSLILLRFYRSVLMVFLRVHPAPALVELPSDHCTYLFEICQLVAGKLGVYPMDNVLDRPHLPIVKFSGTSVWKRTDFHFVRIAKKNCESCEPVQKIA